MLLRNEDSAPTDSISATSTSQKLRRPSRASHTPTKLTAPVLKSPALKTNIAPIVIVAGLLKPAMPSAAVITPLKISADITSIATRSTGILSVAKRTTATTRKMSTITISPFIRIKVSVTRGRLCRNQK